MAFGGQISAPGPPGTRRGAHAGTRPRRQPRLPSRLPGSAEPDPSPPPAVISAPGPGGELRDDTGPLDEQAFSEYVTARSRSLQRAAYLLTGHQADAEDLVQAALAKTYLARNRIADRGALDSYVRRAMINTHISWWRRRRLEEYPTEDVPDQAVADHAGDSEQSQLLLQAVSRLPQRMRAAVLLRYYQDMTEAEVAAALGVSLGTVKSTVSRAMAKLRCDVDLRD